MTFETIIKAEGDIDVVVLVVGTRTDDGVSD